MPCLGPHPGLESAHCDRGHGEIGHHPAHAVEAHRGTAVHDAMTRPRPLVAGVVSQLACQYAAVGPAPQPGFFEARRIVRPGIRIARRREPLGVEIHEEPAADLPLVELETGSLGGAEARHLQPVQGVVVHPQPADGPAESPSEAEPSLPR